jgi:hypothetical protein
MKNFRALQLPLYEIGVPHYQSDIVVLLLISDLWGDGEEEEFFYAFKASLRTFAPLKFKRKHFSEMSDAIFYYQKVFARRKIYLHIFQLWQCLCVCVWGMERRRRRETFATHYYCARGG